MTDELITPELQVEAKRELARRELARRYLIPFVQYNFGEYDSNWHHEVIADRLQRVELAVTDPSNPNRINRLIITMPPRHGKSELASKYFPAWFLGRNPNKEVIAASYGADLAVDFGRKVRNIFETPSFQNVFPGASLAPDSKAANQWNTNHGGAYVAAGVGGAITGKGAHVAIVDDPFKNDKEAMSELIRQQKWDWFVNVLMTRLAPHGAVVLVTTRWHDDDFVGRIGRQLSGDHWEVLNFPAIARKSESTAAYSPRLQKQVSYYRGIGQALWPGRYDLGELTSRKNNMSPFYWSALFQQDPVDEESIEFKREWFKTRKESDVSALMTRRFLTVDTAGAMTDRSDYIGVVDNRVDGQGKWNISGRKFKMSPPEFIEFLLNLHKLNKYEIVGIEKTIYLTALKPFLDMELTKRGMSMPIQELSHNNTAKILRIRALIPRYRSGMVYHIEGECEDMIPQLVRFPKGAEDDIIDALSYQEQIAQTPLGWGTSEEELAAKHEDTTFDRHSPVGAI